MLSPSVSLDRPQAWYGGATLCLPTCAKSLLPSAKGRLYQWLDPYQTCLMCFTSHSSASIQQWPVETSTCWTACLDPVYKKSHSIIQMFPFRDITRLKKYPISHMDWSFWTAWYFLGIGEISRTIAWYQRFMETGDWSLPNLAKVRDT